MDTELRASLLAGVVAGAAGIVLFAVVHWFVIFPTWATLTAGFPFALLTGLLLGWAFHDLRRKGTLPSGRWEGPAFVGLLLVPLLAVEAAALATGIVPFSKRPDGAFDVDAGRVVLDLLVSLPVGLALGWALTREARRAGIFGLAAFALALSLGHNIPGIAGWTIVKMWAVMTLVALVSGVLLAELRPRFAERARRSAEAASD